jgi:hypothetical protein
MSFRKPPASAIWLLNRFLFFRTNPAFSGDLDELYQSGKSPAWYERQAFSIIRNGIIRNGYEFREYLSALLPGMVCANGFGARCLRDGLAPAARSRLGSVRVRAVDPAMAAGENCHLGGVVNFR